MATPNIPPEPEYVDPVESNKNEIVVHVDGTPIEDSRTGQIIPHGTEEVKTFAPMEIIDLKTIGTLVLEDHALGVIKEKVKDEDIQIRPKDGLLYLPWTWYVERLNRAVGLLQWGIIPQGAPTTKPMGKGIEVVWGHWLIIRGIPIGFAVGECSYYPSNPKMGYSDAIEGAKSISIVRNCKVLGMSLELWDKDFCDRWRNQYATKIGGDWTKNSSRAIAQKPVAKPTQDKSASTVQTKAPAPAKVEGPILISNIKKEWKAAAIKKGIAKDGKDQAGLNALVLLLGNFYSKITPTNAENFRKAGLKLIEGWKPKK